MSFPPVQTIFFFFIHVPWSKHWQNDHSSCLHSSDDYLETCILHAITVWANIGDFTVLYLPGNHWGFHRTLPARQSLGISPYFTCQANIGDFTVLYLPGNHWGFHRTLPARQTLGISPYFTCQANIGDFTILYLPGKHWGFHHTLPARQTLGISPYFTCQGYKTCVGQLWS